MNNIKNVESAIYRQRCEQYENEKSKYAIPINTPRDGAATRLVEIVREGEKI